MPPFQTRIDPTLWHWLGRSRSLPPRAQQWAKRRPFRTETVDLGRCLPGDVDNIADVLAVAEGEFRR